ncbi:hypothetical protein N9W65_01840 [Schleiferiaceae bacterium]|nr:hypothetical protein [Schleiferiaceae bacterium]
MEVKRMKHKLRIGLLLDSDMIAAWSYKMLEEIKESNYAEIVVIVENNGIKKRKTTLKNVLGKFRGIFFSVYNRLDKKLHKPNPDAFSLKNINNLISVPKIQVVPNQTLYSDSLPKQDISEIETYYVDIFIRMGFRILRGDILTVAKYGIWSYHHGDNSVNRGGPAGFWEVFRGWDVTGVTLQILNEDLDNGIILYKSFSHTANSSVILNKNNYYWKALSFLPNKMRELHDLGENDFFENIKELNSNPEFYSNPLYQPKNIRNIEMLYFIFSTVRNVVKGKILNQIYQDQWILLYKLNTTDSISKSFFRFNKMIPPKDRFWADPFVIQKENSSYIFIEELLYKTRKGHISVIVMDCNGKYSEPVKVLEADYHMSYPFLIEEDGALFMIPETKQNKTIDLYRCVEFPTKWDYEKTLINDIEAVDATITVKDNIYWLFANVTTNKGASSWDELHIFSAPSLFSNHWKVHPKNPVISDVRQARPAGNFFTYNNNLYRPSQNSSRRYGYGMKINRVTELNNNNYKEETVNSIYPNWDKSLNAVHTINSVGNLTVIDSLMKRKRGIWQMAGNLLMKFTGNIR